MGGVDSALSFAMPGRIVFDVFGERMLVEGAAGNWRLFSLGADGKRSPVNVAIPAFVTEDALEQYLDDLFHERATPGKPSVRRLAST